VAQVKNEIGAGGFSFDADVAKISIRRSGIITNPESLPVC
jgi:hypothetical protein